jgi:hypothetical protein
MLKESQRYDYVEVAPDETASQIRARRASKGLALPVGMRIMQTVSTLPLQSYLQVRFAHIGGKDLSARKLQSDNQRRHDLAAARGSWPMSRTS